MARPARVDYKTAMRSAIDARHQSGEGVKSPGKAGTQQHLRGAGISNEQNKLAAGEQGTGSRSGAKGGPSEHPQNAVAATAAGSPTPTEASPLQGGRPGSTGENVGIGPRAVGPADESVPHAGTGEQGRGGKGGGEHAGHPLNLVTPTGAGKGADGKGGEGGGAQKRGGQAQGKVLPVTKRRGGGGPRKAAPAKKAGAFLKALAGN